MFWEQPIKIEIEPKTKNSIHITANTNYGYDYVCNATISRKKFKDEVQPLIDNLVNKLKEL